jgi:phytol kinase
MQPIRDLLTVAGLLLLFALAEHATRRGVFSETTRMAVHVMGAGVTAAFPLYLGLADVILLGMVFTAFLCGTWARDLLRSVHAVQRPTAGALVFPLGLTAAAVLTWSHPMAYSYAALVLALADPAANRAGRSLRSRSWRVAGGTKSLAGSAAFFVVSCTLGILFTARLDAMALFPAVIAVAPILTVSEGLVGYGLDNLVIPIVAGTLGEYVLGL